MARFDTPPSGWLPPDGLDGAEGDFDSAFAGARAQAGAWARRARAELRQEYAALERDKRAFEAEMEQMRQEFKEQRDAEYGRLRDDRRRAKREIEETRWRTRRERELAPARFGEHLLHHDREHGRTRRQMRLEQAKHNHQAEARAKEEQRIAEHNAHAGDVVDINVAGTPFAAPAHMLARQPGSIFAQWLTGRAEPPLDAAGRLFLDRDPVLFRSLLNFLRSPEVPPPTRDAADSEAVCREAAFYGIRFFPFPLAYALGGHDGAGHLATAELLDVEHGRWRSCQAMECERSHFGAGALGARLHAFGGQNGEFQAMREAEAFDCLRGCWAPAPGLRTPRRNCAGASDGERLYAFGGYDGKQLLSSVEALDPRMRSWQELRPMASPRSSAACAPLAGRLWVLGGTSGTRLRTVEAYDPRAGRWDQAATAMCETRSAGQASSCLGRLYAVGGISDGHSVQRSMECLGEDAGGHWLVLRSMLERRMDFGCCSLDDMLMVAGGQDGEVLTSTEFYKPEIDDWQFGPPMLTPRYGHQLLLASL